MEKEEKNPQTTLKSPPPPLPPPQQDFFLRWGSRKRLRCVKVRDPSAASDPQQRRGTTRVSRRVVKPDRPISQNREGGESQPSSPEKEEGNRFYSTRGNEEGLRNGSASRNEEPGGPLPRFYISLSSKEKEEDFMAMKGCKLPQRPKKRAKYIQKIILLVTPGSWLTDLSQERYEVREKKCSRKRRRGLKAMSMESDSE